MAKSASNGKQGFLSKFTSSFAAIPCGIIIIIFGCMMLWNNEKKNVINKKDVKELRNVVVAVDSDAVDTTNEGKLIATSGKLDYGQVNLVDEDFGISLSTPVLVRKVEIYEWVETSKTTDDKTVYDYNSEWKERIIDSSEFDDKKYVNPTYMPYEGKKYTVENLKVGAFTLSSSYRDLLTTSEELLKIEPTITLPEGYTVNGKYITNSANIEKPEIGDIRVSFSYGKYDVASVLGKQSGEEIKKYTTAKRSAISKLVNGEKTADEMIDDIEAGFKMTKWIFRILGTILVCIGTSMLLSPLTTLLGYIPFLGKIVNGTLGVVTFLVGFAIAIVVIGIAWLVYNTLVGIIMIVVAVGSIVLAKMYLSKKDDGKKPEVKEETKTEENKEEN